VDTLIRRRREGISRTTITYPSTSRSSNKNSNSNLTTEKKKSIDRKKKRS